MSEQPRAKVLVVDDEDPIRRLVRLTLATKYEVYEAADVTEALEAMSAHDIEVVVIDMMMPGMSGVAALPLLRARAHGPVHIVLLTALDDQEHRNEALEKGADDYLTKPVDRRELMLRVQHFVKLGRQERVIRKQLEALNHLQALKDDLTALLVHDLRNPLTAVKSALQLLEPTIAESERGLFTLGYTALNRVMEGVNDLLKVRMLEKGELPLERASIDAGDLARGVATTLGATAIDSNIDLHVHADAGLVIEADSKLMTRALENLVMNAMRHTRGRIDVEVRREGERTVFAVSDRGPGVPDVLKTELFDMYGSVTLKSTGGRRGHGLGLYLVRLVARAHGGEVVVRDREGGGATFQVTI